MIAHLLIFALILTGLTGCTIVICHHATKSIGADEPWRNKRKDNDTTDKSSGN